MAANSKIKKPAATGAVKSKVLKKPCGPINEAINKLKRGVSKVDLEEGDDGRLKDDGSEAPESDDGGDQHRDKAKGQKYSKMKHQLPDHVVDLVERESMKSSSPREFKTKLINKLFVRNKDGKLELDLNDERFEEHRKIYSRKFAKETDTAMPESIFKGLYFRNDQLAFEASKRKRRYPWSRLWKWEENVVFYNLQEGPGARKLSWAQPCWKQQGQQGANEDS